MDLLKDLLHFSMFLFGSIIRIDSINYPNILMLINKIIIIIYLITWI
jgi:hypothetical protein